MKIASLYAKDPCPSCGVEPASAFADRSDYYATPLGETVGEPVCIRCAASCDAAAGYWIGRMGQHA
jgi:hypothetical protein